jgi:hypothetical protein
MAKRLCFRRQLDRPWQPAAASCGRGPSVPKTDLELNAPLCPIWSAFPAAAISLSSLSNAHRPENPSSGSESLKRGPIPANEYSFTN